MGEYLTISKVRLFRTKFLAKHYSILFNLHFRRKKTTLIYWENIKKKKFSCGEIKDWNERGVLEKAKLWD